MTGHTGTLQVHTCPRGSMARVTVELLAEQRDAGTPLSQMAVLARVNSALLPVQVALTEAKVAHTAPLDGTVLGRTGLRTALSYLRMGLDLDRIRRDDLFDTINRPARKVKSVVTPLLRNAQRFSISQLEGVADALDPAHRDRFNGYLADLRHLEHAITDGADTSKCLWIIGNRIGLDEAMDALDASRTRPEGSSHGDDLDALEQLAELQPDPAGFRDWLTDRLHAPADPSGVTLATVHRVKGMEWDQVVVFAVNQGLFPHRLSEDVEEERRVFHVALTRCRERVDVVADTARPSPFVAELRSDPPLRPRPRAAPPAAAVGQPEPRYDEDGATFAERGVTVTVPGGITGLITEVERDHAVVVVEVVSGAGAAGGAQTAAGEPADADRIVFRVPFGQPVRVAGKPTWLVGTRSAGGATASSPSARSREGGRAASAETEAEDVDPVLFESLRAWRARIAVENGVPAYLVFHDRHLRTIASRGPASLRELAGCPGVGPTKLERYGDDILDVIASHVS